MPGDVRRHEPASGCDVATGHAYSVERIAYEQTAEALAAVLREDLGVGHHDGRVVEAVVEVAHQLAFVLELETPPLDDVGNRHLASVADRRWRCRRADVAVSAA